jgi:hypothetical protein
VSRATQRAAPILRGGCPYSRPFPARQTDAPDICTVYLAEGSEEKRARSLARSLTPIPIGASCPRRLPAANVALVRYTIDPWIATVTQGSTASVDGVAGTPTLPCQPPHTYEACVSPLCDTSYRGVQVHYCTPPSEATPARSLAHPPTAFELSTRQTYCSMRTSTLPVRHIRRMHVSHRAECSVNYYRIITELLQNTPPCARTGPSPCRPRRLHTAGISQGGDITSI